MSLYNMIMGRNPFSPYLLALLGITQETQEQYPVGRIRDTWINEDATKIFVLHRNYAADGEADEVTQKISQHPLFVANHYADKDSTFGWYEFNVPQDAQKQKIAKEIAEETDNTNCFERYWQVIDDMNNGKDNEMTKRAETVGRKILDPIIKSQDTDQSVNTDVKHGDGSVKITIIPPKKADDNND